MLPLIAYLFSVTENLILSSRANVRLSLRFELLEHMKRSAMVVRIGTWSRTTSQKRMINSILILLALGLPSRAEQPVCCHFLLPVSPYNSIYL